MAGWKTESRITRLQDLSSTANSAPEQSRRALSSSLLWSLSPALTLLLQWLAVDLRSLNLVHASCDSAQAAHSARAAGLVLEAEETAVVVPASVRCSAGREESSRLLSVVSRSTPACSTVRTSVLEPVPDPRGDEGES